MTFSTCHSPHPKSKTIHHQSTLAAIRVDV